MWLWGRGKFHSSQRWLGCLKGRATAGEEWERLQIPRCTGAREAHLLGHSMLPFLLLALRLQLLFHVLDVAGEAVAVEVVVTGCLGEGLLLLQQGGAERALCL